MKEVAPPKRRRDVRLALIFERIPQRRTNPTLDRRNKNERRERREEKVGGVGQKLP